MVIIAQLQPYRLDRKAGRRGGGLCMFVKSKYDCDSLKYSHLNFSTKEVQLFVLEICLPSTTPIVVINCYRPPSENVDIALDELKRVMDGINLSHEIYVMGDFNLDYMCKGSPTFKKLCIFERSYQLKQFIDKPTRVSNNCRSTIDHIYSNSSIISCSGTLNINTSDHYPCFVVRKKPKPPLTLTTFTCRKLKHFNYAYYRERLEELNWRPFYNSFDPIIPWDLFYKMVLEVVDKHYPLVTFKMFPLELLGSILKYLNVL